MWENTNIQPTEGTKLMDGGKLCEDGGLGFPTSWNCGSNKSHRNQSYNTVLAWQENSITYTIYIFTKIKQTSKLLIIS